MKLENILEELSVFGHDRPVPREALAEAARQREAVTPILLDALDRTWEKLHSEEYEALCEEPGYDLSYYGIFLLGQFREQAAFPKLLRILTLDEERLDLMLGDLLTDDGFSSALYGTYDGSLSGLRAVICDTSLEPFARSAALNVLDGLLGDGRLSREDAVRFLRERLTALGGSEAEQLFGALLVRFAANNNLYELVEEVRSAYRQDQVEVDFFGDFDDFFDALYNETGPREHTHLLEDTAAELEGWSCFQRGKTGPSAEELLSWSAGRNDPCPCGSGKKFKKCCLPKQEALRLSINREWVPQDEYPQLDRRGDRPGLLEFYDRRAVEVDQIAYRGMKKLRRRRRVDRKSFAEARKLLWQAFERFRKVCEDEGLETPEDYDRRYKMHYLCAEWLEELLSLLDEGEQYEAVKAVLSAQKE